MKELLAEWQMALGVDWTIELKPVRPGAMAINNGRCRFYPHSKRAVIYIVDCATNDLEVTLVHELLHLKLVPCALTDDKYEEHLVELLAQLLVRLKTRALAAAKAKKEKP